MIILESKLRVPNYSLYLVRNRLFSFIENHLDRSLICLTSDGGYGKTTLISSFVKEKKASGRLVSVIAAGPKPAYLSLLYEDGHLA